jgi:hypothetical protein
MLSPSEFTTLFVMSSGSYGLNAFQIHRDVLYRNLALLFNIAHGLKLDKKLETSKTSSIVFIHAQQGSPLMPNVYNLPSVAKTETEKMMTLFYKSDINSLRQCEKLIRKYMDMPSYDRIMRNLEILKKEGFVFSRDTGKGAVWSIPPEIKEKVLNYASTLTLNDFLMEKLFS